MNVTHALIAGLALLVAQPAASTLAAQDRPTVADSVNAHLGTKSKAKAKPASLAKSAGKTKRVPPQFIPSTQPAANATGKAAASTAADESFVPMPPVHRAPKAVTATTAKKKG